jgi:eukaryotic-like serine/threonine-protein kinase
MPVENDQNDVEASTYPASLTPASMDWLPLPGDLLEGKYTIGELLGQGGMSHVYLGQHLALQVPVAIKFLRGELKKNPEHLTRFLREARLAASIRSEHATRIYDVASTAGGQPYIVMEHLESEDLDRQLEKGEPLLYRAAVDITLQTLEVLAEAHEKGLIHRDIKPANLVVQDARTRPRVKVLDFGVSLSLSARESQNGRLTAANALLGSPAYMSPEQLRDSGSVDARSDLWSCGVTLYELLTKALPFRAEGMPALCAEIISGAPVPLRTERADLPPGLAAVVMQCLEKVPDARPASARQLARQLAPYASQDGQAKLKSWASTEQADSPVLVQTLPQREAPASSKKLWLGLLAFSVIGIAMAVFYVRSSYVLPEDRPTQEALQKPPEGRPTSAPTAVPSIETLEITRPALSALPTASNSVPAAKAQRPVQVQVPGPKPPPTGVRIQTKEQVQLIP